MKDDRVRGILDSFLVFIGAGLGGVCRHLIQGVALRAWGSGFPFGTFLVNLLGAFLIGLVAGILGARAPLGETARLFFLTGVLGGFTTFSSYALETLHLIERGSIGLSLFYALGSVVLGVLATLSGFAVVRLC